MPCLLRKEICRTHFDDAVLVGHRTSQAQKVFAAANVFFNGRQLDINSGNGASKSRSFTWENANANYIGLSARTTTYAEIDNLAIRKLPLAPALASEYALNAGLTVPESGLDSDPDGDGDNNFEEWLKGGNPNANDNSRQLFAVSPSANGEFRFSYYRLTEAIPAGVVYSFRYSTDLANWTAFTPEQISSQAQGIGYEHVESRVPVNLASGQPVLFVLLEIRAPVP